MSKTHLGHITIKAPLRFHVRDFDQQSAGWIIFFSVSYFFSLKIKKKNCIFLFFLVLFLLSFPFENVKMLQKMISARERHVKYTFASQNTQHLSWRAKKFQTLLNQSTSGISCMIRNSLFIIILVTWNFQFCAPWLLCLGQVPQVPRTRYGPASG